MMSTDNNKQIFYNVAACWLCLKIRNCRILPEDGTKHVGETDLISALM